MYEPILNKNLVIISSKIITSNFKFSYVANRSIYSPEQRFPQTLETIGSIRKYIPNSYIVLIDNSLISQEQIILLKNKVEILINITTDVKLNYYTNESPYKALGEISQLIKLYDIFLKNIDLSIFSNIFKISGRYLINNNFKFDQFMSEKHCFKQNKLLTTKKYYYTSFYRLSPILADNYFNKLREIIDNFDIYSKIKMENLEEIIPKVLNYDFMEIETLGITQKISVWDRVDDI